MIVRRRRPAAVPRGLQSLGDGRKDAPVRGRARAAAAALVAATATAWPGSALAGRPLDTDDAAIIPRGTCQLESFARRVGRGDEVGPRRDVGIAPSCNPFGWGELLVGAERDAIGQPGPVTYGVVQVKAVPVPVSRTQAGWGFTAAIDEGFAQGQGRPAARVGVLNGIASVPVASAVQIDANLGWIHEWAPAANGRRDHLAWGLAGEWAISPAWTLVAERVGASRQGFRTQVGWLVAVSPRVTLDGALGRRRQPGDRAFYATLGITIASAVPAAVIAAPAPLPSRAP